VKIQHKKAQGLDKATVLPPPAFAGVCRLEKFAVCDILGSAGRG